MDEEKQKGRSRKKITKNEATKECESSYERSRNKNRRPVACIRATHIFEYKHTSYTHPHTQTNNTVHRPYTRT